MQATASTTSPARDAEQIGNEVKAIVTETFAEFAKDAGDEIVDCDTNADTGRGVSRTELDNVPGVFEELARLEDSTPYALGNAYGWSLTGQQAAEQIAVRRVAQAFPELEFDEVQTLVEKCTSTTNQTSAAREDGRINTQFDRAMDLLAGHGYRVQSTTTISGGSLHIFTGPKGAVIVQTYAEASDGVTMYADWPLGTTWEATEIALSK